MLSPKVTTGQKTTQTRLTLEPASEQLRHYAQTSLVPSPMGQPNKL